MRFYIREQVIILPVLAILITITMLSFPSGQDQYAHSQSAKSNSTTNTAGSGVNLVNIRPSPLHLTSGSKFEILSTVVNNSPSTITFVAGRCDSPLSVHFSRNVLIRHIQGCTATSPPFKLHPGEQVSVAGPGSGTIYTAMTVGQTTASATLHYQTENGQAANVTKPFVFTIS